MGQQSTAGGLFGLEIMLKAVRPFGPFLDGEADAYRSAAKTSFRIA